MNRFFQILRLVTCSLARAAVCGAMIGSLGLAGCAAFRPIDGVPARYVPDEVKAPLRSGKKTIDLSLLSQTQPSVYHLDGGDVLAIYVEGVIPRPNEMPPVNIPFNGEDAQPALGYPVPVRQDGTIALPMLPRPLTVRGLTVKQVEDAVRKAYTVDRKILQQGTERVWVILHRPRKARVLVIRQEGVELPAASGLPGAVNLGTLKRGTGRVVTLSAYKNDVLHALAETGGLPGLDAENTIYVIRGKRRAESAMPANQPATGGWSVSPTLPAVPPLPDGGQSFRPLPNDVPPLTNPPQEPNAPVDPQDATPGPQTRWPPRSSDYSLQPAVLGFESGDSPQRVSPISFNADVTGRPGMAQPNYQVPNYQSQPMMNGSPNLVPMVSPQMTASPMDWQSGWPPTQAVNNLPEVSAEAWMGHSSTGDSTLANQAVTKIPVRLAPGEQVRFTERDIILEDGDIVFIESRDTEIFYTGGLLGGGQYTLPRDYDLDVLGALAIAQAGRAANAATRATGGITALNNDVTISASQAVILRKMCNGSQVPIKVDLYRALRHPEERVLMQPGDFLLLQYTPLEACGAFFERHLLEGALFGVAAAQVQGNH